jgi:hypothetical protein
MISKRRRMFFGFVRYVVGMAVGLMALYGLVNLGEAADAPIVVIATVVAYGFGFLCGVARPPDLE